jgi:NTE family protein
MDVPLSAKAKRSRLERSQFEQTVLLLQGGGALGSYQAGVYQALVEADLDPDWVAGISIGAINAALIAGNPRESRVKKLREFWEAVSTPPLGVPHLASVDINDGRSIQLGHFRPIQPASRTGSCPLRFGSD